MFRKFLCKVGLIEFFTIVVGLILIWAFMTI